MACIETCKCGSLDRSLADREFWVVTGDWVRRSRRALHKQEHFEALIYLWISFNAWVGCVVEDRDMSQRDRFLVASAAMDELLAVRFDRLLQAGGRTADAARRFHSFWPVFKARSLSDLGLHPWGDPDYDPRTGFRAKCFRAGLKKGDWAPRCFVYHQPDGTSPEAYDPEHVPLDWTHTLHAIYMVRCNLFHGGKSFRYSGDAEFVEVAAALLGAVWLDGEEPRQRRAPRSPSTA